MSSPAGYRAVAGAMLAKGSSYEAHIPEHWRQGRTAFGGLTSGLALRAAQLQHGELPPLRSAMVSFIGPVTEHAVFTPEIMREGKNVTSISVDVRCAAKPAARAAFVFGQSRDSDLSIAPPAITGVSAPKDYPDFTPEQVKDFVPKFFHNFETKLVGGARPISGADEGYIQAWSRHIDPGARAGTDSILAIGDVLPGAAMPMFTRPGVISSVTWMVNMLTDNPVTDDGWWLVDTRLSAAQNGYSSQHMGIWNRAGEKIAEGMQSVAIFV